MEDALEGEPKTKKTAKKSKTETTSKGKKNPLDKQPKKVKHLAAEDENEGEEFSDNEIYVKRVTRRGRGKVVDDSDEDCTVEEEVPVTPRKKRVINSIYRTNLVEPVKKNKKTPLKIKFTR